MLAGPGLGRRQGMWQVTCNGFWAQIELCNRNRSLDYQTYASKGRATGSSLFYNATFLVDCRCHVLWATEPARDATDQDCKRRAVDSPARPWFPCNVRKCGTKAWWLASCFVRDWVDSCHHIGVKFIVANTKQP